MSATTAGRLRTGLSTAARSPVVTLAAALATSVVLGLFLAEVGLRTGPLGVIALLVLMALAWVALSRPHALVAGLALLLPVGLVAVGPLELVQLAMALVVVLALAQAALRRAVVLPPWQVGVPLVAMLLAAGLATAAAHDPDAAFRLDVRLALEVLMVVALTTTLTVTRHVHQVARALVVAGGVIAGWALLTAGQVSVYLGGRWSPTGPPASSASPTSWAWSWRSCWSSRPASASPLPASSPAWCARSPRCCCS